jgi:hypothetical protein
MTCLLKARTAEPEETAVARERLGQHILQQPNHATAATDTHATIEEVLETVFSMQSV